MAFDFLGGNKTQTTTTNPYASVMPGIEKGVASATDWFDSGKGPLAPMNSYTKDALNQTRSLAGKPVQGLAEANAFTTGLIGSGGWTPELTQTANDIRGAMGQANSYFSPFMNGEYQNDPLLAKVIAEREKRAMNGAATQFGGGRYGSTAIGQGMGRAMSSAGDELMLQSNENSRNRQLQAISANSGIQLQGGGLLGQLGEGARGAAMQGVSQLPMLNDLGFSNIERLAGVGDYFQNRRQQVRDYQLEKNKQFAGLLGQYGGMGSSTTSPKQGSGLQSILGGAAMGAGVGSNMGKWGPTIGSVAGGLLSLF